VPPFEDIGFASLASRLGAMSADDEKDPPVPANVEGKIPRKVHDDPGDEDEDEPATQQD
jgi:hypothetical protein